MSGKFTTRFLTETEYPEWNGFVANSPNGSVYSTPEYLDVLCGVTGGRFQILVAERSGKTVGGIALYERPTAVGWYVSPRLLLYYNGFVLCPRESKYPSEQSAHECEILGALEEGLVKAGFGRLVVRNRSTIRDVRVFAVRGWRTWLSYTYVVPVANLRLQWGRVEQNLRRLIQRCGGDGMRLSEDDDFDSFFRMHEQTHERKSVALYLPRNQFACYFRRLSSQKLCRLYHARLPEGRSVSSQLVLLGPHPVTHSVCAGTDPGYMRTGVTAFLRWKVFEELAKLGYLGNDLTDAALNRVTHFKSQFGGDLEACINLRRPESAGFRIRDLGTRFASWARSVPGSLARQAGLRRRIEHERA